MNQLTVKCKYVGDERPLLFIQWGRFSGLSKK